MPKLASLNNCTGCTACANICPHNCMKMKPDVFGFMHPVLVNEDKCVECRLCEKICPVLKEKSKTNKMTSAYAALSCDENIRLESSSGGIFTELAKSIILKNGVVYGAAYDEQFTVRHCCVESEADLRKLRGAKYAESNLGNTYKDILNRLKKGQFVLFSGTPCQVAGLKSFVRKDFHNLFCVDFVCYGVPSPEAWKAYIEFRSKEDADGKRPCSINLRSKETGWSRYQYSNVFEYDNGEKHSVLSFQSLYMKMFTGDYISRQSCENCNFKGYNRCSDITLGDFWGIWDIDPEMDDNKGTSVVLLQSEKGKKLWEEIKDKIKYKQVTLEQASQYNPSMLVASKAKPNRDEVLKRIGMGEIGSCEELFVQKSPSLSARVRGKISRGIHKILGR